MIKPSFYHELPPGFDLDQQVGMVQAEFHRQSKKPPRGDFFIGEFSRIMTNLLDEPYIQQGLSDYLIKEYSERDHAPVQASAAVNFIFRVIQKQLLFRSDKKYPEDFESPSVFKEEIPKIFQGVAPYDSDTFYADLIMRKTQTNKWERYRGLWLPLHVVKNEFDNPPTILDIGCSQNKALNRLKKDELEYDPEQARIEAEKYRRSLGDAIVRQLVGKLAIGRSIGVDLFNMFDQNVQQWAKSCSFEPKELLDKRQVDSYDAIEEEVKGVEFRHLNYANSHPRNFRYPHLPFDLKFNVVNASFVFEQSSQKDTDQMIQNGKNQLQAGGFFIVQGYIKPNEEDKGQIVAVDNWHESRFNCLTLIYEEAHPEKGFQELLRWYDGRMRQVRPGADLQHFRKRFAR